MKINELKQGILYIEDAVTEHKKFLSFIEDNNANPKIQSVIPAWETWWDGYNLKEVDIGVEWVDDLDRGLRKKFNWDESDNGYGRIWPKITPNMNQARNLTKDIIDLIDIPLKKCLEEFYSRNSHLPKLEYITKNYDLRKYNVGIEHTIHVDNIDRNEYNTMDYALLIYLNDDYEGGEIYFPDLDIEIKPSAGSVIIFDAYDILHGSKKILSGNKYYIALFIHSPFKFVAGFREEYAGMVNIMREQDPSLRYSKKDDSYLKRPRELIGVPIDFNKN